MQSNILVPEKMRNPGKSGFTLTEMLIVMGIILVLAALLMTVISKGRSRAERTSCLSSIRQWVLAQNYFAADHDDALPRDGMGQNGLYPGNSFNGAQTGHPSDPKAWF